MRSAHFRTSLFAGSCLISSSFLVACADGDSGDTGGSGGTDASGTGGAVVGSGGGAAMSGGASASGGASSMSGGASSGGGSAAGGSASGGSGSGGDAPGTGGMASGPLEPADLVGDLDGFLYKGSCNGGTASFECPLSNCVNNVFTQDTDFEITGEAGKIYDVTIQVYGVVETRHDYVGGMRRQGATSNDQSMGDFFYTGGGYTEGQGYNVYGVRVEPAVEGAPVTDGGNNYFLNARDGSNEGHEVFKLDYEMTIPVPGDGKVSFKAYDPNCMQIMNNNETVRPNGSGTGTNGSIVVSEVDSAMPAPQGFMQPLSSGNNRTGQWVFFDVTKVEERM